MYLFVNPYRELLQSLEAALIIGEGILKITGTSATGKSALCSQLSRRLRVQGKLVIHFTEPPTSPLELQQTLQLQLQISTNNNFTRALTQYLQSTITDQVLYLIFDDADKIDDLCLENIRLLGNIQNHSQTLVKIVLCGNETLVKRFQQASNRALAQHLGPSFNLLPMSLEQLKDFCRQYWREGQVQPTASANKLIQFIYETSRGLPGAALRALAEERSPFVDLQPKLVPNVVVQSSFQSHNLFNRLQPFISLLALAISIYALLDKPSLTNATPAVATTNMPAVSVATSPSLVPTPPAAPAPTVLSTPLPVTKATTREEIIEKVVADNPLPTPLGRINQRDDEITKAATVDVIGVKEIAESLDGWVSAWQQQKFAEYFAHYADEFTGNNGASRAAWEADRIRVMSKAQDINIHWHDLMITEANATEARIEIRLDYVSFSYADTTVKELVLRRSGSGLRISTENNLQVIVH